jgi:hypothetical protein
VKEESEWPATQLRKPTGSHALSSALGFRLYRTGRTFRIMDTAGALAFNSKPAMSLAEIELWIGEHIKPKKTA